MDCTYHSDHLTKRCFETAHGTTVTINSRASLQVLRCLRQIYKAFGGLVVFQSRCWLTGSKSVLRTTNIDRSMYKGLLIWFFVLNHRKFCAMVAGTPHERLVCTETQKPNSDAVKPGHYNADVSASSSPNLGLNDQHDNINT